MSKASLFPLVPNWHLFQTISQLHPDASCFFSSCVNVGFLSSFCHPCSGVPAEQGLSFLWRGRPDWSLDNDRCTLLYITLKVLLLFTRKPSFSLLCYNLRVALRSFLICTLVLDVYCMNSTESNAFLLCPESFSVAWGWWWESLTREYRTKRSRSFTSSPSQSMRSTIMLCLWAMTSLWWSWINTFDWAGSLFDD